MNLSDLTPEQLSLAALEQWLESQPPDLALYPQSIRSCPVARWLSAVTECAVRADYRHLWCDSEGLTVVDIPAPLVVFIRAFDGTRANHLSAAAALELVRQVRAEVELTYA